MKLNKMFNIKDILTEKDSLKISVTLTIEDLNELIKETVRETVKAIEEASEAEIVWLSPKQVSERLHKDRATLWRWNKEGYLCGKKFGNRVRYRLSDVERIEAAEKER